MRQEREEKYKQRIERCLTNQVKPKKKQKREIDMRAKKLSLKQRKILRMYYMALTTGNTITKSSRKARSYATFYEYMRHLRRFGLFLNKDYMVATRDDVEDFI